jgi:hypothetical protein
MGAIALPPLLSESTTWEDMMRNVILACVMAASVAGCSWTHRDRNTESSGSTTPPPAQAQSQQQGTATSGNSAGMDWNKCDEHPYTPGPARACK